MDFSVGDVITIITIVGGLIGLFIKMKLDISNINKDLEKHKDVMDLKVYNLKINIEKDLDVINKNSAERDVKFEKVLDKLEGSIEKLNECQMELTKAIIELRVEIKSIKE